MNESEAVAALGAVREELYTTRALVDHIERGVVVIVIRSHERAHLSLGNMILGEAHV